MYKRVLISGFEAFAGSQVNPTALLIESIEANEVAIPANMNVRSVLLPVSFKESFTLLKTEIDAFKPDYVLAFGVAGGRSNIEFERVAINCMDSQIPDNDGFHPRDTLIDPLGPVAYFSTLPFRKLEAALIAENLPCKISNSAGAYVCNYLFYKLMERNKGKDGSCGFIHVPELSSLDITSLRRALEVILIKL